MPLLARTFPIPTLCRAAAGAALGFWLGAGLSAGAATAPAVALSCTAETGAGPAGGTQDPLLAGLCDALAGAVRARGHDLDRQRAAADPPDGTLVLALRVERARAGLIAARLEWRRGRGAWAAGPTIVAGASDAPLGTAAMRALARALLKARPGPLAAE